MRPDQAMGVLVAALAMLAGHYGHRPDEGGDVMSSVQPLSRACKKRMS